MTARPPSQIAAVVSTLIELHRTYGVPLERVRLDPLPGRATVVDVEKHKHCELVNGTLVEKAMGLRESLLAAALIGAIRPFVKPRKLGLVSGEQGTLEILGGLVRIPDVAFISRQRLRGGRVPEEAAPALAPDLAIEVVSKGNTAAEMKRKRAEYFEAGVRLVWMVDPVKRTVTVYSAVNRKTVLTAANTLDGGDVLPGFTLPLRELFAELDDLG